MDRDVAGIRISPASAEFFDTVPDTVEQLNVTVYNISKGSKSIRFYAPKTKVKCIAILLCIRDGDLSLCKECHNTYHDALAMATYFNSSYVSSN